MKTHILASFIVLAMAAGSMADPDSAPFINGQFKALEKKVASDLASGALTKSDADELTREIDHAKTLEENEPRLTPATRRNLREDVSGIQKDLERKEGQAKALATASPSATP